MMNNRQSSSEKPRKVFHENDSALKAAADKNPESIETDGFSLSVAEK